MSGFESQSLTVSVWKVRFARMRYPRASPSGCKHSEISTDPRGSQAETDGKAGTGTRKD